MQNLAALALRYSLNPYTDLRNRGVQTIESVMRRYPALVPAVLPAVLRALAGIPQSSGEVSDLFHISFKLDPPHACVRVWCVQHISDLLHPCAPALTSACISRNLWVSVPRTHARVHGYCVQGTSATVHTDACMSLFCFGYLSTSPCSNVDSDPHRSCSELSPAPVQQTQRS